MYFDINKEIQKLKISGITLKMIEDELKLRDIPEIEFRYFGCINNKSKEQDILSEYNTNQLKNIKNMMLSNDVEKQMEEMEMESKNIETMIDKYKLLANDYAETVQITNKIKEALGEQKLQEDFNEIKEKLSSCKEFLDYTLAFTDLQLKYNEVKKLSVEYENKYIDKFGEKKYGVLMLGSKKAYKEEQRFEKELLKAKTAEDKMDLIQKRIIQVQNDTSIDLWANEVDDDYQQAQ